MQVDEICFGAEAVGNDVFDEAEKTGSVLVVVCDEHLTGRNGIDVIWCAHERVGHCAKVLRCYAAEDVSEDLDPWGDSVCGLFRGGKGYGGSIVDGVDVDCRRVLRVIDDIDAEGYEGAFESFEDEFGSCERLQIGEISFQ